MPDFTLEPLDPTVREQLLEQLLAHMETVASRLDNIDIPTLEEYARIAVRREARSLRDIVTAIRSAASEDDVARCRVCGCTEDDPCPGGCFWATDADRLMDELCSRCVGAVLRITVEDLGTGERAVRGVPAGQYAMVTANPCTYTVVPLHDGEHRITTRGRTEQS